MLAKTRSMELGLVWPPEKSIEVGLLNYQETPNSSKAKYQC